MHRSCAALRRHGTPLSWYIRLISSGTIDVVAASQLEIISVAEKRNLTSYINRLNINGPTVNAASSSSQIFGADSHTIDEHGNVTAAKPRRTN